MSQRLSRSVLALAGAGVVCLQVGCGDGGGAPEENLNVASIHAGVNTTCATVEEGTPYCWGANEYGQVGDGTTTDRPRPTVVTGIPDFVPPIPGDHTCALDLSALFCWGRNDSGELGRGTTDPGPTPAVVTGGVAFQQVVVGDDFSCGLAISGATYCWGANDVGQLGTGIPGPSPVPVPVAGSPQFSALAAGGRTACGATVTGELLCWGNGADGELGTGAFDITANIPGLVASNLQFTNVAIGANAEGQATVCAFTTEANYCWGKNGDGEIGDGTKVRKASPTLVLGDLPASQLAPGGSHTCARTPAATVYCWGKGGRLGTGGSAGSTTPVAVTGDILFSVVFAGRDHACGRTDDEPSTAYCWGENSRGQLGDGTTIARLAPTRVSF
jgi:alpha-tubulin suppressor-like RCC1 family protein